MVKELFTYQLPHYWSKCFPVLKQSWTDYHIDPQGGMGSPEPLPPHDGVPMTPGLVWFLCKSSQMWSSRVYWPCAVQRTVLFISPPHLTALSSSLPFFHSVPSASRGDIDNPFRTDRSTALWWVRSLCSDHCPVQKGTALTKAESISHLWAETWIFRRQFGGYNMSI